MRVLHIINSLSTGGAEKLVLETIPKYNEQGIKADVLLLNGTDHPFLKDLRKQDCCEIFILGNSSPYQLHFIFKLLPYFKKYDLIHAHLFPSTYFSALAKKISLSKTPLVFTEHNTSNKRFRSKRYQWINSLIYSFFDQIICITSEVRKEVLNKTGILADKLTVINNGVDIFKIQNGDSLNRKAIDPLLSPEDFLLCQVSSFREQKDQKTVIKSLTLLPEKVKLLLVGDGALKEECVKLVQALDLENRVFFLGIRNDIPQLIKTSDVNILSSIYEGLSLSSIEGMAAGKPFIASDVPGLSEVVGGAGILFPKGDYNKLAEEISGLMTDEKYYVSTAQKCQERAFQFDIEKMVDKHIALYRHLTKNKKSL